MKSFRPARVAEAVREVASETILFKMNDPRVKAVTVTRAEVSADLQTAKIYVSIMGTPQEQRECLQGLHHAAGFLQRRLAERLQMRFTPAVTFVEDKGVKNSIAVAQLLRDDPQLAAQAAASEDAAGSPPADEDAAQP
jgi:ribosome-binding factor A